jgi:hypothetical protein
LRGQRNHRTVAPVIREFNLVCIDCGQPSIAGSATAKRCAEGMPH